MEKLSQRAKDSRQAVDDLLTSVPDKFKSEEAKSALGQIYKDYSMVPGLEAEAVKAKELLKKKSFTLAELNAVKREMDTAFNIYKKSSEVSSGLKAKGLNNIRVKLKNFIEETSAKMAEKYGNDSLKLIQDLNNETAVSYTLADAISKKDSADYAKELV